MPGSDCGIRGQPLGASARPNDDCQMPPQLTITALQDVPLVKAGDDLAAITLAAYGATDLMPQDGDVLVVAQKIVSKAEDRIVDVGSVEPSPEAIALAAE